MDDFLSPAPDLTAAALLRRCPPLRQQADVIRDDFAGDYRAYQRTMNERYMAECAAFDAGWAAADAGRALTSNPFLKAGARLAWVWADGWEAAGKWVELVGRNANWLREGARVRIVRHNVIERSLKGRVGTITTVHRRDFLGYVVVTVPPQGRQKKPREGWFRVNGDELEPVDE